MKKISPNLKNAMSPFTNTKYITEQIKIKPTSTRHKSFLGGFEMELKWVNVISISLLHFYAAYAALFGINWTITKVLLWYWTAFVSGFGVTAGAHRYFCHRSFNAKWPLKLILLFCYTTAGENTIPEWVRDHRVHHKYSETDADPHNSNRGFFFAHCGWLMMKKHPEVLKRGKSVDISDVTDDPLIKWHTKYFTPLKILCCFVAPTLIFYYCGADTWMEAFNLTVERYIFVLNSTWSVNSAAHIWGYKPFNKNIKPSENVYVSAVALGEGWHNYHHTFPWDYKASELGKDYNMTTKLLNFFSYIGWAYGMKAASPELVQKYIDKNMKDGCSKHQPVEEVPDECCKAIE